MTTIMAILTVVVLSGCETAQKIQADEANYQKDLVIVDGKTTIIGLGTIDGRDEYNLTMSSRHNPNIVRISNCHRDVVYRDQRKQFNYQYKPNRKIESGGCILQMAFLDSKGFHQFGALSFREADETVPATLACNGAPPTTVIGASTCQGKEGTIQQISFKEPMDVRTECEPPRTKDHKSWFINIKGGYCLLLFKSRKAGFHKLVTYGYNEIINQ